MTRSDREPDEEMVDPVAVARSICLTQLTHGPRTRSQLAETLRTMSTRVIEGASITVPLDGRRLDAAGIAADPALASLLQGALDALASSVAAPSGGVTSLSLEP